MESGPSQPDESDLGFVGRVALRKIREGVTDAISRYDQSDLQNYILTDYDVVENDLPDEVRKKIERYGSSQEHLFRMYLHPENVYGWVSNPDWAPSEEVADELQDCAEVLEETPGAEEWLYDQVYQIWEMAGIDPPDSSGKE